VNEYLNKFTQLSRYAPDDVNTDEKKQDAFLNGLNDEIQFQLLNTDYEDFQRMVDKAIIVENKLKEMERNGKWKMPFQGQSSGGNTRPHLHQPNPFFRAPQMIHPPMQGQRHPFLMQRPSFQMQHSQQQAPRPNMQQQHHVKFLQPPRPTAQPMQNTSAQGNQGISKCFECGMTGHFARKCPNKQSTSATGNQSRTQVQQNYMYGKVNQVTSEEAQQTQDVILGMFVPSSNHATVLFDSGASHSFVSSSFVAKYNLPITTMRYTMLVSSPGGVMRTKHICPAISISIRG
jgi:hypothetical protein